jgi:hypothetical protein
MATMMMMMIDILQNSTLNYNDDMNKDVNYNKRFVIVKSYKHTERFVYTCALVFKSLIKQHDDGPKMQ